MKTSKIIIALFLAIPLLTAVTGCKKDKDEPTPDNFIGKYVVVSSGSIYKYIEVTNDTLYLMMESGFYSKRNITAFPFTYTADSITLFSQTFKYSYSNGELKLYDFVYSTGNVIASKNSNVPAHDQWVRPTTIINLGQVTGIPAGTFYDMTSYGNQVVTDAQHNGTSFVFKVLTIGANNYTSTEIPVDPAYISRVGYEDNIEYINGKFLVYEWSSPTSYFYRINTSTGITEADIPVTNQVGNIYAIASDGTDMFGMSYDGILKFDFVNNTWGNELKVGGAGAMAGKEGFIYLVNQNEKEIQKFNTTTNRVEDAFKISDNYNVNGLAFSGNDLIASVYNYDNTHYELLRIQLP